MDVSEKIQRWIEGLRQFSLWDATCDFFKDNEKELVDTNIMNLRRGLNTNMEPIWPLYASWYAFLKRENPKANRYDLSARPYDVPNLGRKGDFYEGIHIECTDNEILFTSSDIKWEHKVPPAKEDNFNATNTPLKDVYGEDVLGIAEEDWDMVGAAMSDYVSDQFRKIFD